MQQVLKRLPNAFGRPKTKWLTAAKAWYQNKHMETSQPWTSLAVLSYQSMGKENR